jgi:hypothetical protein
MHLTGYRHRIMSHGRSASSIDMQEQLTYSTARTDYADSTLARQGDGAST